MLCSPAKYAQSVLMMRKILGLEIVSPEEMEMLQRVFDAVCYDPDKKSPAADDDARLVVALFRSSWREENDLLGEFRMRKAQLASETAERARE